MKKYILCAFLSINYTMLPMGSSQVNSSYLKRHYHFCIIIDHAHAALYPKLQDILNNNRYTHVPPHIGGYTAFKIAEKRIDSLQHKIEIIEKIYEFDLLGRPYSFTENRYYTKVPPVWL